MSSEDEVPQFPGFLLQFTDYALEKQWRLQFAQTLEGNDWLATLLQAVLVTICVTRFLDLSLPTSRVLAVVLVSMLVLLIWAQCTRLSWYRANRTSIVVLNAISQAFGIAGVMLPNYQARILPLASVSQFQWSIQSTFLSCWPFIIKAFIPIFHALSFRLPVVRVLPLLFLTAIGISVYISPRCNLECSTNPSYYDGLYTVSIKFLSSIKDVFVFAMGRKPDGLSKDPSWACLQMCNTTQAFFLSYFGVIVPVFLLLCIEELDRLRFLSDHGGTWILPERQLYYIFYLFLMPFCAAIIYELLEISIKYLI